MIPLKILGGFAMELAEIIGENIRQRRMQLGMSQKVLAMRIGVSQTSMNQIEKGTTVPKFQRLDILARTLQCSVACLFRPYIQDSKNRAEIIVDALSRLPNETQDALVNLIVQIAETAALSTEKVHISE